MNPHPVLTAADLGHVDCEERGVERAHECGRCCQVVLRYCCLVVPRAPPHHTLRLRGLSEYLALVFAAGCGQSCPRERRAVRLERALAVCDLPPELGGYCGDARSCVVRAVEAGLCGDRRPAALPARKSRRLAEALQGVDSSGKHPRGDEATQPRQCRYSCPHPASLGLGRDTDRPGSLALASPYLWWNPLVSLWWTSGVPLVTVDPLAQIEDVTLPFSPARHSKTNRIPQKGVKLLPLFDHL